MAIIQIIDGYMYVCRLNARSAPAEVPEVLNP